MRKKWVVFPIRITGSNGNYHVDVNPSDSRVERASNALGPLDVECLYLRLQRSLIGARLERLREEWSRHARPYDDLPSEKVEPISPEDFGNILSRAVFGDDVRRAYTAFRTLFRNVVISLDVVPPELALLPWELLRDPDAGGVRYFARDREVRFYRTIGVRTRSPAPLRLKPRLLFVSYAPDERPLDFTAERNVFDALKREHLIELDRIEGKEATYQRVHDALRQGGYSVFHFAGHGGFSNESSAGAIRLADGDVPAQSLATLFRGAGVVLAVLNSCQGTTSTKSNVYAGTAQQLADSGVAAVVGMQHPIFDSSAASFAKKMYGELFCGMTVAQVVTEARISMMEPSAPTAAWATPVLFLAGEDRPLFERSSNPTSAGASAAPPRVATAVRSAQLEEEEVAQAPPKALEPPQETPDIRATETQPERPRERTEIATGTEEGEHSVKQSAQESIQTSLAEENRTRSVETLTKRAKVAGEVRFSALGGSFGCAWRVVLASASVSVVLLFFAVGVNFWRGAWLPASRADAGGVFWDLDVPPESRVDSGGQDHPRPRPPRPPQMRDQLRISVVAESDAGCDGSLLQDLRSSIRRRAPGDEIARCFKEHGVFGRRVVRVATANGEVVGARAVEEDEMGVCLATSIPRTRFGFGGGGVCIVRVSLDYRSVPRATHPQDSRLPDWW